MKIKSLLMLLCLCWATTALAVTVEMPAALVVPSSDPDGSYTVSWSASATSRALYVLEEATTPDFSAQLRVAYSGKATKAKLKGRLAGATYYYRVKATLAGADDSAWQVADNGCGVVHVVSIKANGGGVVTPSGTITIPVGSTQQVAIAPNEGYQTVSVVVDGVERGPVTEVNAPAELVANVKNKHKIKVKFKPVAAGGSRPYTTADLKGTWHLRSIGTQKNGGADNFGYETGEFGFASDGDFTGTVTDDEGFVRYERGASTVATDGTVNLWVGEGVTFPAAMNASKDVIIANYQDEDQIALDIFAKRGSNYATSNLAGVWYLRSIGTQRNGQADHFGYDTGTFAYQADGDFTAILAEDDDSTREESGSSTVRTDGTVDLRVGEELTFPAAMNASKDVIIASYQDDDEFGLDVFVKKGTNYSTAELEGTWYSRRICTQKNSQADNFGYQTGTFTYQANGAFTATLTDDAGNSRNESGSSSVTADGTVDLWVGRGLNSTSVMNAGKNLIVSNDQDADEYCLDIFVKAKK